MAGTFDKKQTIRFNVNDSDIYKVIFDASDLSATSKRSYTERLRTLRNHTSRPLLELLSHPRETYAFLIKHYSQVQSQKAYINVMLTIFKHDESLRNEFKEARKIWREIFETVHAVAEKRYDDNLPSEKQQSSYIPWTTILEMRDALPKDSLEYLWMCCHTMIPPLRADLDKIKIHYFHSGSKDKWNSLTSVVNGREILLDQAIVKKTVPNFLNILINDKAGPWRIILILTEFKTAKSLKLYKKELPSELAAVMQDSLTRYPRDYLFVSPATGQPFNSSMSYTRFANRLIQRVLYPYKITISMLRHIFISSLDHGRLTSGQKNQLAKDMMHSPAMFDRYRLFMDIDEPVNDDEYIIDLDAETTVTGTPKKCLCKCR